MAVGCSCLPGPVLSPISHGLSLPCPSPGKDAYCHPSCVPLSALGPETAGPGGPRSCQTLQGPSSLQAQAQACTVQPERRGWGGRVGGVGGSVLKSSASDFSGECHNFLMHLPRVRKADCVQGDKDGCQLSLQPVPVTSLAQRPGGVRAESPLRVVITSHLC